jgi:hypothetical protein
MTPQIEKKRFDTLFYIAFIDSEPETHINKREISELVVNLILKVLKFNKSKFFALNPISGQLLKLCSKTTTAKVIYC